MNPVLDGLVRRLGPRGAAATSAALTALLGLIQLALGPELSFSVFYVLPVALTAWYGGRLAGLVMCGFTAAVWLWADLSAGQIYSHPAIPVWNASVRLAFFLIITHLILALRAALAREAAMADTDSLTGLANGRRFYEMLESEIARFRRSGRPFSLAYMDADNFKSVNDRHGHAEGDRVLVEIAACLRRETRATDVPARLGGDEFAVLFPECDEMLARQLLPRVRSALLATMEARGWPVGFSVGTVTVPGGVVDAEQVVHAADELMYEVKTAGKNEVRFRLLTGPRPAQAAAPEAGGARRAPRRA